jgi:hypothetical protein
VHPYFSVPTGTDPADNPRVHFKHENWNQFIRPIDQEVMQNYLDRHQDVPSFGLIWIGTRV